MPIVDNRLTATRNTRTKLSHRELAWRMVDEEVYVSLPTVYRILRAAKLTESAFLQLEAGNSGMYFFALAVLLVFLVLAAQFDS